VIYQGGAGDPKQVTKNILANHPAAHYDKNTGVLTLSTINPAPLEAASSLAELGSNLGQQLGVSKVHLVKQPNEARLDVEINPRTSAGGAATPPEHRGRIQVQGGGLELAFPWARQSPMTKEEALAGMDELRLKLNRKQLAERNEAFESAKAFINATLHTCPPEVSRTFQNRAVRLRKGHERVDIEIRTGSAFA
jgi:hypothetical protein